VEGHELDEAHHHAFFTRKLADWRDLIVIKSTHEYAGDLYRIKAGAKAVTVKLSVVDVLVNNLGIFEPKPFTEIPDEDWCGLFEH
jgi:NAD(P)-dependent dehydrogenase (short-subunit alcohol dehydrogenase family)